jgi:ADP-dependent NAD(P)H-hydrate dehydratase / NAD(P)H-hydrate epimerase
VMSCAVKAEVTVTFIALKQGLLTGDAAVYCGELVFAALDIPADIFTRVPHSVERVEAVYLSPRERNAHKGHYGHVLVIGGDIGFSGAARLAAEASLRSGAGLVSVATRQAHAAVLNSGCFELMCHPVEQVSQLRPLLSQVSVIVLGVGLGKQMWGQELFVEVMLQEQPKVIDADGLNLLVHYPFPIFNHDHVLTPHVGEAARLLRCSTESIMANRFDAVRKIQGMFGGVVVLKGAGSLIFDGKTMFVSNTGNPGMASGGMGDVLAGMIGGLIAQGLSLMQAAKTGVYLHGLAADLAARQAGERGLLASDLMPFMRKLVN